MEVKTLCQTLSAEIKTLGLLKKTSDPPVIRWRLRKWALICSDSGGMLQRERGKNKLKKLVPAKKKIKKLPKGVWMRHFPLAAVKKEYGDRYLKGWIRFTDLCHALELNGYPAHGDSRLTKDIDYCGLLRELFEALTVQLNHIQYHRIGEEGDYFVRQLDTVEGLLERIEETMKLLGDCIQQEQLSQFGRLFSVKLCTGTEESAEELADKLKAYVDGCKKGDHCIEPKPKREADKKKKESEVEDKAKAAPDGQSKQPEKSAEVPAPAQASPEVKAAGPNAEQDRRLNVHLTLGLQVDGAADVTAGTQQDKGESK